MRSNMTDLQFGFALGALCAGAIGAIVLAAYHEHREREVRRRDDPFTPNFEALRDSYADRILGGIKYGETPIHNLTPAQWRAENNN